MASKLCPHCNIRAKAQEGGKVYDYCSKSCASAAINSPNFVALTHQNNGWLGSIFGSNSASTRKAPGTCLLNGCSQPVYVGPTGKASQYCSKLHMNQSMTAPASNTPNPANAAAAAGTAAATTAGPNQYTVAAPQTFAANMALALAPGNGICLLPGCGLPVWIDANGAPSDYCSKAHQAQGAINPPAVASGSGPVANFLGRFKPGRGVESCLWCHNALRYQKSPFCGFVCSQAANKAAPGILTVPSTHPTFKSVADQFEKKWKSGVARKAKHVYLVLVSDANMKRYHAYRDAIEGKRQIAKTGGPVGNVRRRWHGTRRYCNIGDPGHTKLCSNSGCALCSIIRSSFSMKFASSGLFGKGIYTSSTSSKADGYSSNGATSPLKAMLLNKVVVGRGHKVPNFQSFTAPPSGYDSILGEMANDECIVFNDDAIRPAYLVMY